MALMMPDRHYVSHGRYWGGGTNRMPLCYMQPCVPTPFQNAKGGGIHAATVSSILGATTPGKEETLEASPQTN